MSSILLVYLALLLMCAAAELLRRARWIDRLALVTLVLLGAATRPTLDEHRASLAAALAAAQQTQGVMRSPADLASRSSSLASRLVVRDFYVLSITTMDGSVVSVGLFDRVFVSGAAALRP